MGSVTTLPAITSGSALATASNLRPADLALIRRTVAADTNDDEFNLFISYCLALRLDPRRRQIYAFVYNKTNATKRKMSIIVAIDGLRTIADRTGAYRPDEDEPTFEVDAALKGSDNPFGLVKATVRVWKFSHGDWHKVTASAYWTEYAPLTTKWSSTVRVDTGDTWPDGNTKFENRPAEGAVEVVALDQTGKWPKMGRVMLAKCAEALALRKAWPDDFSGVHAEEEMARVTADDLLPAEAAQASAIDDRMSRINAGRTITVDWLDGGMLEAVPVGKFMDKAIEWLTKHADEPSQIGMFQSRNRHGLREFWALEKSDALELKARMESALTKIGGAV